VYQHDAWTTRCWPWLSPTTVSNSLALPCFPGSRPLVLTDWLNSVVVLRPTWHKTGHFREVSPSQSFGLVWKKLNLTQQKQAFTNQKKCTTTQKLKLGFVAFYDSKEKISKGGDKKGKCEEKRISGERSMWYKQAIALKKLNQKLNQGHILSQSQHEAPCWQIQTHCSYVLGGCMSLDGDTAACLHIGPFAFVILSSFTGRWRPTLPTYSKTFHTVCFHYTRLHTLHTRTFVQDYPGGPVPKRQNQSGFYWSKRQWVAVAWAGPYASLHLAPDR